MSRFVRTVLSSLLFAVAGCSAPPPTDPHGFPNTADFQTVDSGEFLHNAPGFNGLAFSTPGGLACSHNGLDSMLDPSTVTVSCTGPIPAQGSGTWRVAVSSKHAAVIAQSPTTAPQGRALAAGKRLTYQGIECVVDDTTTACRVGPHGFVLTPQRVTLY
jgi:hypothetical protein